VQFVKIGQGSTVQPYLKEADIGFNYQVAHRGWFANEILITTSVRLSNLPKDIAAYPPTTKQSSADSGGYVEDS